MKRSLVILIPLCCLLLTAGWTLAAGSGDPLASLSYLEGDFTRRVESAVEARLDAVSGAVPVPAPAEAVTWTEKQLKASDILTITTGGSVLPLAGSVHAACPAGMLIDVTSGTEVPGGAALTVNHRYMAAEDTTAMLVVTSKTAVMDYQGAAAFSYSDAVDYIAMASALKTLHLFRGSSTGYGQGFDLEMAPTRVQALIMFIRVLGEEEEALSWTGTTPFTDVAAGSLGEKYIGYAYEKGYTNGVTADTFRPSSPVSAGQYAEFLLRATGYSTAGSSSPSDALDRAQTAGLLNAGEAAMLQTGQFLRADLVYLSCCALEVSLAAGGETTLAQRLLRQGVFTAEEWASARTALEERI